MDIKSIYETGGKVKTASFGTRNSNRDSLAQMANLDLCIPTVTNNKHRPCPYHQEIKPLPARQSRNSKHARNNHCQCDDRARQEKLVGHTGNDLIRLLLLQ